MERELTNCDIMYAHIYFDSENLHRMERDDGGKYIEFQEDELAWSALVSTHSGIYESSPIISLTYHIIHNFYIGSSGKLCKSMSV